MLLEEGRYLKILLWYSCITAGIAGLFFGVIGFENFIQQLPGGTTPKIAVVASLSGQSGLTGMGIIAAIIIALHVAVRGEGAGSRPRNARAIARLRYIQLAAFATGAAAIIIGIATARGYLGDPTRLDIMRGLGPVLGGLLLAFFAADASNDTASSMDAEVSAAAKRVKARALDSYLVREQERSVVPRWQIMWVQMMGVVLILAASGLLYGLSRAGGLGHTLVGVGIAVVLFVAISALVAVTRWQWNRSEKFLAVSGGVLGGFVELYLASLVLGSPLRSDPADGGLLAVLARIASVALPVTAGWFLSSRLPRKQRGLMFEVVVRLLRWRSARNHRSRP